jgi:hypothetical protein
VRCVLFMSKPVNRIAKFQAQSSEKIQIQDDLTRFRLQNLKRFLSALADLKQHGCSGEITESADGVYFLHGRLRELTDALSDLSGLTTEQVFEEWITGALERLDEAGEEGFPI